MPRERPRYAMGRRMMPTGPRAHGTFVLPWHTVAHRGPLPRDPWHTVGICTPWHTVGICTPWHTVGACHGTRGRLPRDPWALTTGPVGPCHGTRDNMLCNFFEFCDKIGVFSSNQGVHLYKKNFFLQNCKFYNMFAIL